MFDLPSLKLWQLGELEVFRSANCVKVNPDSPQKQVRFLTLSGQYFHLPFVCIDVSYYCIPKLCMSWICVVKSLSCMLILYCYGFSIAIQRGRDC